MPSARRTPSAGPVSSTQWDTARRIAEHAAETSGSEVEVGGRLANRSTIEALERAGLVATRKERSFSPTTMHGPSRFRVDTYASLTPAGRRFVARGIALSDVEHAALRKFVATFDAAVARERERWGADSAAHLEAHGIDVPYEDRKMATALEERGAAIVERKAHEVEGRLRKGAFGRLVGGSHKTFTGSWRIRPTAAGRKAAAAD